MTKKENFYKIERKDKPLTDSTVTRLLTYSLYSRYSLKFNIQCLNWYQLSTFWHYICILQDKRKDLNIFDVPAFYEFTSRCFKKRDEPLDRQISDNYRKLMINEENKEKLNLLLTDDYYKEYYGDEYDSKVQYYTKVVNNPEEFIEDLEEQLNAFRTTNVEDIWPDDDECKELWIMFNENPTPKKETALLNSIASLIHVVPERDRILAYYIIKTKRIKLAEYPLLDMESKDPYVIQPKLKRPITDNILNYLADFARRYENKEADEIVFKWLSQKNIGKHKLFTFISLIMNLQINGIQFIEQEIFDKVFEKEIEFIRINGEYCPPNQDNFFYAIQYFKEDNYRMLRQIAVLVQEGYNYKDIYDYFKDMPTEIKGIVF